MKCILLLSAAIAVVEGRKAKSGKKQGKHAKSAPARSAVERQLGMTFLTEGKIAREFDVLEGAYVTTVGLVNFDLDGPSALVDNFITNTQVHITYDEFQRACVTNCYQNENCDAVAIQENLVNAADLGLNPSYYCKLVDVDARVRDVPSAQVYESPKVPGFATAITYVRKGKAKALQVFEPCDIDYLNLEASLVCLGCPSQVPPSFDCTICPGLIGDPADPATWPQSDFWTKLVPAAQCLGAQLLPCSQCLTEKAPTGKDEGAGVVCTANDAYNAVRGLCRAECYEGFEQCEASLQTSQLCTRGSVSQFIPALGFYGGAINTPYECPPVD